MTAPAETECKLCMGCGGYMQSGQMHGCPTCNGTGRRAVEHDYDSAEAIAERDRVQPESGAGNDEACKRCNGSRTWTDEWDCPGPCALAELRAEVAELKRRVAVLEGK